MTHHDLISSYIDNELTTAQEQEFLISLAANDNLRSSFRTELTLKNIVHRDESLITPPRALRASVFAAVGLSAAAAPEVAQAATQAVAPSTQASTSTVASQSSTFFKTLFATKMNALFTTLSLSVATLVGFVGHDVIVEEPAATQTVQTNNTTPAASPVVEPVQTTQTEVVAEKPMADAKKQTGSRVAPRVTRKSTNSIPNEADKPASTDGTTTDVSGTGEVSLTPPVITPQK
jgi:hypothetical protein